MKTVALISKEEEGIYSGAKLELPRPGKHGSMSPCGSSLVMFYRSRTRKVLKQGKKYIGGNITEAVIVRWETPVGLRCI